MADKEVIVRVKVEGLSAGAIEVQKLNIAFTQLNKEYKDLQKTIAANGGNATQDQITKLASLAAQMKDNKNAQADYTKTMNAADDSLNKMRADLIILKENYANAGAAAREKMAPAILDLNNKILASEAAIGVHQRDVGNYAAAWSSIPGPIGRAATTIQGFKQTLQDMSSNLGKSVTDISGVGKATGEAGKVLQEFGAVAGNETGKAATVIKGFGQGTKTAMNTAGTATEGFGATIKAAGKAMLSTPIGWLILGVTALIGIFAGLFNIWKSTGEGAAKMKDIMASLHAVMDVLKNMVVGLIDVFSHLFKGEFKQAAEGMKDTFGGMGEKIKEAADRAGELSKMQRQLTKDLAMHISEEANENNKIQEYLMLSKDKTKSDKERLDYLKEAMRISEEKAKREMEFAQQQFNIDIGNAALKGQIDEKMLADWIAMDQEKQKEALAGSEKLRNALNILGGTKALEPLEQSYAKIINAETEFFQQNKRTTSQISTLEKELATDRDKRAKERITLREMEAKGDVELMKKVAKEKYEVEIAAQDVSDTQKLVLKKQYEEEVLKIEQDAYKERLTLLEDQAKGDIESMKKVAKLKYDAEISVIGISNTQKEILQRKYNDEVSKLDSQLIDEFKVKQDERKALLKTSLDLQLKDLTLNEDQKAKIVQKYNSDIDKIDKDIADKRKAILEKSLTDDLELYGKDLKGITDTNSIKLTLQKKYEDEVKTVQAKKLDKSESDKEIAFITDRLTVQLAKVKEYEKDIDDIDKKTLADKKITLKASLDEQIKNIEDEKKLYIESQKEKGTPLNTNNLYELEKETQTKILALRTDFVDQSAKLDADYYAKKTAALEQQLSTDLELTEGNAQAQEDIKKKYAEDVLQINADAVITAQNALLAEVEAVKAAEEQKRQFKIASGEWDKERTKIDADNEIEIQRLKSHDEFEAKRATLAQQYAQEIQAAQGNGAAVAAIKEKYRLLNKKLDQEEVNSHIAILGDFAGVLSEVLGKNTAAGKAAAVAQATINTYLAASQALATYPPPFSYIAMAAAIITGIMNVQKIIAVDTTIKSTGGTKTPGGYVEGGKITNGIQVHKSDEDNTINIVGTEADKTTGGKITSGIAVKTGTKDDKLIAVNDTETVITDDQMKKLGGPDAMAAAGVPGYFKNFTLSQPSKVMPQLGSGILNNIKFPGFVNGGFVGLQPPTVQTGGFNMNELNNLMLSMRQNIESIDTKSDAINSRIDKIQVIQDVNKLNLAQKELTVINQTSRI
jgi:hypothetical protein